MTDEEERAPRGRRAGPLGSVQGRLILLMAVMVALAMAVAALFLIDSTRRQQALTERQLSGTSRALALALDGEIGKAEAALQALATSPSLAAGDLEAFDRQARRAVEGADRWIVLKDPEGRQLVNTSLPRGAALPGPDPTFEARWQTLSRAGRSVSNLETAREPPERVLKIETLVRPGAGPAYDLGLVMRPRVLQDLLARQALARGWYATVIDRGGTVVARNLEPERWVGQPATPDMIRRMKLAPSGAFESESLDGVKTLVAYDLSTVTDWTVLVAIPRYEAGGDLTSVAPVFIVAIVLLLLTGAGLTIWFARDVAGAVRDLTAYARRLGDGGEAAEPHTGLTEIDYVGRALKHTAEALNAREHELRRVNETLEARVEDATSRLVQSQKIEAMGRLTGGVAHDFNNLLTAVVGNLELLKRRNTDPNLDRFVDNARAAAQRGASLTAQLLAFSRRQRLSPEPTDLNGVVESMAGLLRSTLGGSIAVEVFPAGDLPLAVADRTQIEMVLLNLAINARDAMPDGGVLHVATGVETVDEGDDRPGAPPAGRHVAIAVTDNGWGMTPEVLAHALEPFFTTKGVGEGSGLGLSQALGTVQQLGGGITLKSEMGVGTEVKLYLPVAETPAPDAPAPVLEATEADDGALSGLTVLLVDDDDAVRQIGQDLLEVLGCEVIEANGGTAALRAAEGVKVDIALIDYAMPVMTGVELADRLRAAHPGLPIVITSGFAGVTELTERWPGRVLPKPYTEARLLEALRAEMG